MARSGKRTPRADRRIRRTPESREMLQGTAESVRHGRPCPRVRARSGRRIADNIHRRDGVQPARSRLAPVRTWSTVDPLQRDTATPRGETASRFCGATLIIGGDASLGRRHQRSVPVGFPSPGLVTERVLRHSLARRSCSDPLTWRAAGRGSPCETGQLLDTGTGFKWSQLGRRGDGGDSGGRLGHGCRRWWSTIRGVDDPAGSRARSRGRDRPAASGCRHL